MTTFEQGWRELLTDIVKEAVREELGHAGAASNAKALTRRQAEKAMGVGRSKLQDLIATGAIKTVQDNPRLVPASEVARYCQPRRQKPRRTARPAQSPQSGVADGSTTRERLAQLIKKGKA